MKFDDWKRRLEAGASEFDDPGDAFELAAASYDKFMGVIIDFMNKVGSSRISNRKKAEIAVGFLRGQIDIMAEACTLFVRRYPEESHGLIDWHQSHIEFFEMIAEISAGVPIA